MSMGAFQHVGIISIGDMGLGIAQVLLAHGYQVFTYAADRSETTQQRARKGGIELSSTLQELIASCSCILSIVPPRDAHKTAQRILSATPTESRARSQPLFYVDLNSISPESARYTQSVLASNPNITLIDGGIIGGVPYNRSSTGAKPNWHCPSLIVSGPERLPDPDLSKVLNMHHLSESIGVATGLKMCYGVTTKGFYALAIESFTTAQQLGVLPELRSYLERYSPSTLELAEKGLVTMPPKAYRWVHEMLEIADTMAGSGGFDKTLFQGVAEVYRLVAEDSDLGKEQPGARIRGKTVEDVVKLLSEGLMARKRKLE